MRALDDVSDTVCTVYDGAELCRNTHAEGEWRAGAATACTALGGYVHSLNTHAGLYGALGRALAAGRAEASARGVAWGGGGGGTGTSTSAPSLLQSTGFSTEAARVGDALARDFERAGVHLPEAAAAEFAALTARAQALGMAFSDGLASGGGVGGGGVGRPGPPPPPLLVPARCPSLAHIPPSLRGGGAVKSSAAATLALPPTTAALASVLRWCPDGEVRRGAYLAAHGPAGASAGAATLADLLACRARLAELVSASPSWAAHTVGGGTLAGEAGAVWAFLSGLAAELRPAAEAEAAALARLAGARTGAPLAAWDRPFYEAVAKEKAAAAAATAAAAAGGGHSPPATPLTLQGTLAGIADLLATVLGVRLTAVAPASPGELWAPGVQKLAAACVESGAPLGTLYLDPLPRPAKFPGAAHFTLRAGRAGEGGEGTSGRAPTLPVVALVTNFGGCGVAGPGPAPEGTGLGREREPRSSPSPPCSHGDGPLSPSEASTLLHEVGHALHSLLSRTAFQHLSGTRGPLDLVEVPSHLAERWLRAPASAALATRGGLGPLQLAAADAARRATGALDLLGAVLDAMVDQALHGGGGDDGKGGFPTSSSSSSATPPWASPAALADTVAALHASHSPNPLPPHTSPAARFGHLVGYGGAYYSYLYADCIAGGIWGGGGGGGSGSGRRPGPTLADDPLSRAAGTAVRESLLAPGCAGEPRGVVGAALGGVVLPAGGGWAPEWGARLREVGL